MKEYENFIELAKTAKLEAIMAADTAKDTVTDIENLILRAAANQDTTHAKEVITKLQRASGLAREAADALNALVESGAATGAKDYIECTQQAKDAAAFANKAVETGKSATLTLQQSMGDVASSSTLRGITNGGVMPSSTSPSTLRGITNGGVTPSSTSSSTLRGLTNGGVTPSSTASTPIETTRTCNNRGRLGTLLNKHDIEDNHDVGANVPYYSHSKASGTPKSPKASDSEHSFIYVNFRDDDSLVKVGKWTGSVSMMWSRYFTYKTDVMCFVAWRVETDLVFHIEQLLKESLKGFLAQGENHHRYDKEGNDCARYMIEVRK